MTRLSPAALKAAALKASRSARLASIFNAASATPNAAGRTSTLRADGSIVNAPSTVGAPHNNSVGGNEQCQGLIDAVYDGDSCTSNGNAGRCSDGTCIEIAKTGLTDNSDGKPCNANGVVGVWSGGTCVAGVQPTLCTDAYGNPGHYDTSNMCLTLTGNQGDPCVGPGGIGGVFDAQGNCISCSQYQQVDQNGQCIDAPCPACMGRFNPGEDCVPITGQTPSATNPGCDPGDTFDPNFPGDAHCCWGCSSNTIFDTSVHSCVCPANLPNWDGTKCVGAGSGGGPPPVVPPVPPAKCPQGQVAYAGSAAPGQTPPCVVPPVVPPTPPKKADAGSDNTMLYGVLALGALAVVAVVMTGGKKSGSKKSSSKRRR